MKSFFIFCSVVATIAVVAGQNYCDIPCKRINGLVKNIGCDHNKLFDAYNCPKNAKIISITDSLQKILVDAHNEKRNFIAGGGDKNHKRACRMATMQWDNNLAYLADLNVKQCRMAHDKCHNTKDFQYTGQNLAIAKQTPVGDFNVAEELGRVVQDWFDEVVNSTQSIIDSYPSKSEKLFGHFTVMMADRNIRLGCAAATYDKAGTSYFLTACNYATTNMIDHPIYAKCTEAGELCQHGKNLKYPNLCKETEKYAVNKWF